MGTRSKASTLTDKRTYTVRGPQSKAYGDALMSLRNRSLNRKARRAAMSLVRRKRKLNIVQA